MTPADVAGGRRSSDPNPNASRALRWVSDQTYERMLRRAERQHERALATGDVEAESIYLALLEELRR